MRLATLSLDGRPTAAVEENGSFYHVVGSRGAQPPSILELLESGSSRSAAADPAAPVQGEFTVLAPFPRPPRNIICLGKNYASHAKEFGRSLDGDQNAPEHPIVFTKATTTVTGPTDTVVVDPSVTEEVDYEVELGVVIGRTGRFISSAKATNHVAGYLVINDITARDLQRHHNQFFLGKSLDGFCPMGPVFVTADELDGRNLELGLSVDGEVRQHGNTRDLVFDVPSIIEIVSSVLTLQPGDIIATGTPEGVGLGFDPPRYLGDGSVVEAWVEGIGRLRNRIEFRNLRQEADQPALQPSDTRPQGITRMRGS